MRALDAVILTVQERGVDVMKDLKCPNPECGYMTMIDEKPPRHCPECGIAWGKSKS
jgi:rubrerythrin